MSTPPPESPSALQPLDESFATVLVVVAHPDDIEYGTAAAVARWTTQGKTVTYLLATRGEAGIDTMDPEQASVVREQEERDGGTKVGVEHIDFLDFHDGVVEYGLPLRREICRVIRERRPDVIVGSAPELRMRGQLNQSDHRAVALATLDAIRDAGNRWIFPDQLRGGLKPWGGVGQALLVASPNPSHYVEVGDHLETAIASLEAHEAYNSVLPETFPKPRALVTMILEVGGKAAGVGHAVVFEVWPF
ncbi:MAG: PIG-L family deacetylase [Actinomycetota bacterium]|nr:PIG-L family deacetylase [Actinomycetota bacterium]